MACCLFCPTPTSEPMLACSPLRHKEHISIKFNLKSKGCYSRKCIWKCHLQNGVHLVWWYIPIAYQCYRVCVNFNESSSIWGILKHIGMTDNDKTSYYQVYSYCSRHILTWCLLPCIKKSNACIIKNTLISRQHNTFCTCNRLDDGPKRLLKHLTKMAVFRWHIQVNHLIWNHQLFYWVCIVSNPAWSSLRLAITV